MKFLRAGLGLALLGRRLVGASRRCQAAAVARTRSRRPSVVQQMRDRGRPASVAHLHRDAPPARSASSAPRAGGDLMPSAGAGVRRRGAVDKADAVPRPVRRRVRRRPRPAGQGSVVQRTTAGPSTLHPGATRASRSSARCCGPTSTSSGDLTSVNGFAARPGRSVDITPRSRRRGRRRARSAWSRPTRPPARRRRRHRPASRPPSTELIVYRAGVDRRASAGADHPRLRGRGHQRRQRARHGVRRRQHRQVSTATR